MRIRFIGISSKSRLEILEIGPSLYQVLCIQDGKCSISDVLQNPLEEIITKVEREGWKRLPQDEMEIQKEIEETNRQTWMKEFDPNYVSPVKKTEQVEGFTASNLPKP